MPSLNPCHGGMPQAKIGRLNDGPNFSPSSCKVYQENRPHKKLNWLKISSYTPVSKYIFLKKWAIYSKTHIYWCKQMFDNMVTIVKSK